MWLYASIVSSNLGVELKNPDLQVSFQITDIFSLISQAIGWSLIIGALILFMCIIVYGVQWINSGGDTTSVTSAKTKITNCLFGFAVLSLTYTIALLVQYFLGITVFQTPGSVFTPPTPIATIPNFVPTPTPIPCQKIGQTCSAALNCCTDLTCTSISGVSTCRYTIPPVIIPPVVPPPVIPPVAPPVSPSGTIDLNGTTTINVSITNRIFGIYVQPSNPTPYINTYITNTGGNIVFQKNTQTLGGGIYEFSINPSSLGVGNYTWHTYFCNDYSTWCSSPILIKQVDFEIVP